ncbi:response regulator [Ruminococcus sp. AM23-1]|nr:response regulator [Ruminococcus sp. AM23-1]
MRNYMMERFLERISLSEYKNQFILKGGMLVAAMVGLDARATMDLDATIKGTNVSVEDVEMIISQRRSCIMNRILIIDDDKALCELIKRSVQAENIEADFCNTGKEGLQKLKEQEYQLVVLDVMMPGMDGFETLEEIRKEYSLPILMFTSKNDSLSKVRGLRAGADDYLTKPFDMDELIARIASLIRRYTRFNQQAGAIQKLNFNGLQIDLENRSVTTSNGTFELPPKEFDLLLYCAKHQGKILTKQQIYEEVWGEEYFYDDSNIMAIISRLRKKLEVNPSSPKYIQTVKGIGYRFNKEV